MHGTIESLFRVEWRPLAELGAIAAEWRALADRALVPNVFYEPSFALAAAPVLGEGVGVGLVWSRAAPSRLVGLFPARVARRRYGAPLPILVGWTHPFAPLGAPLIDRELAEPVIAAWLEHVATQSQLPKILLLPFFPREGALAAALAAVVARRGGSSASFAEHRRAMLAPTGDRAAYLERAIGAKKRKELRRQRKRLGESAPVRTDTMRDAAAIAPALADFLALEAGGWKGRAGTAARDHAATAAFMKAAVTALAAEGKASVTRLAVGARPVAAMVVLRSGTANAATDAATEATTAWAWKVAYDESYARYSPGTQVLLDVTQMLLDDPAVSRADSCADAEHPMIDHVWRERLALGDLLVAVGPGGSSRFALVRGLESLRCAAIGSAKRVRNIVKPRP